MSILKNGKNTSEEATDFPSTSPRQRKNSLLGSYGLITPDECHRNPNVRIVGDKRAFIKKIGSVLFIL